MINIKKQFGRLVTTTSRTFTGLNWPKTPNKPKSETPTSSKETTPKGKDLTPGMPIDDTDKVSPSRNKAQGGYDQNDKRVEGKYNGGYSVEENQFYRIMNDKDEYLAVYTKDGNSYVRRASAGNSHFIRLCRAGTNEPISKEEFQHILSDTPDYYKLQFTYQKRQCKSYFEDPQNKSDNVIPVWPKK